MLLERNSTTVELIKNEMIMQTALNVSVSGTEISLEMDGEAYKAQTHEIKGKNRARIPFKASVF